MTDTKKVIRGVKMTFLARVVNTIANGLLILLLSRFLLGPEGYGLLFLTLSILAIAQLFADVGLARSAARYVAEFKESDPAQVPHILHSSFRYRLVLVGIVCLVLVLARDLVVAIFDEPELAFLLTIGVVFLVFQSLKGFAASLFQGFNRVEYSALVEVVDNVGRVTFVVSFMLVGWGVAGAVLGYAVSAILAAVIGLAILYGRFYSPIEPADAPTDGLRRRILEYSVPLTASRSANIIDRRIDIALIGFFLNPAAVGFYTLAKQLADFVITPANSVGFALSPTYGEVKANDQLTRAARIYETSLEYVLLLYVPAVVGLLLVAEPAILLVFGADYAGSVPVVQILSVFIFFKAVNSITTQGIDYLGRARFRAIVKSATSIANLLLNIILIPTMGIVGAAVATVITFGIYTTANVYVMHVELPLQYSRLLRITGGSAVVSIVMGACVVFAVPFVTSVISLLAVITLGVVLWGLLVTISGLLDVRETLSLLT